MRYVVTFKTGRVEETVIVTGVTGAASAVIAALTGPSADMQRGLTSVEVKRVFAPDLDPREVQE